MSFLLKFLLILIVCLSTNCDAGNTQNNNENVDIDTLSIQKTTHSDPIDSVSHLKYPWKSEIYPQKTIQSVIKVPEGFQRVEVEKGSFADWLRHLPLKEANSKVYLYNGDLKSNQLVHEAVIDIDVGNRDLQQCADAVMRLRSEYLFGKQDYSNIHFNFTSGDKVSFDDWRRGKKPIIRGNKVNFSAATGNVDNSYANFKKYLVSIFSYAGTASLSKEMENVNVNKMEIGDVFIQGGFPGHAIIVVDMAVNYSGEKVFLVAQSYMPAQEIHVLKNINRTNLSPWYSVDFIDNLYSPEWTFSKADLKRFKEEN